METTWPPLTGRVMKIPNIVIHNNLNIPHQILLFWKWDGFTGFFVVVVVVRHAQYPSEKHVSILMEIWFLNLL